MLRAAKQLLFCGACGGLTGRFPQTRSHHLLLQARHLSSASGRQWLKHVLPESVYPAFRHERREVPVYIRIPDVPRQQLSDDCLFVDISDNSRLVRVDSIDWVAYYDRVHRELQAGATLHDQLLDAAVGSSEADDPSAPEAATFDRLVRPLLQHRCRLLELIWAGQLAVTLEQSDLASSYARLVDSLIVKLRMHLQECYQDADYLASLERVRNLDKSLTDQQIWVVNKEIRECRRACFYDATTSQPPKQMSHVATQMRQLAELAAKFETNVVTSGTFYRMVISDPGLFESYAKPEFLEHLRSISDEEGLYVLTLTPGIYDEFIQVCKDRASRQAAWSAHCGVAGRLRHFANRLDNPTVISDQRIAFDTLSEALGYENRVAIDLRQSSQDGLPQSAQSVVDLLEVLKRRYQPIALDHFNRVSDFAQDNGGLTDGPLQPWDWEYWQRRLLAEHSYPPAVPMAQLRQNWFDLIRQLFGLSFEANAKATGEAGPLHPHHNAEVFDLRRLDANGETGQGALLGRLVWLSGGRMRKVVYPFLGGTGCLERLYAGSSDQQQQPVAYQAWDLPIVANTDSAIMAERLAAVLQQLTGHPAMGPYLCPDRQENRSYFLPAMFRCLATWPDPNIQQRLLSDGSSSCPDWPAVSELLAGQQAMNLLHCLYRAAYAFELWSTDANWQRAQTSLGRDFLPFFQHDLSENEWPCSALDIFGLPGLRESALDRLFNTVLAMDAVGVLSDPSNGEDMGARFRDSFLDPERGHSFVEAYRRFCGRDPAGG
ncbi:hypothetical protein BOX15_Mlig005625g2 [Macrostomum lignano]|uniref:Peptidase M3A/M3B catalytic domain-containing protein n=1 Tax=Macrostomum lignano TaxID=282301 RepID=A0A267ETA1_9PLAT|nr:hypothetical protein BOX15_Mlig005625g2 [Macrostomum lignano]